MALELRISTGSPTPIYRQIVDQIRHAVACGVQRAGDPLPSVRGLAEQLVINANTVAKAYNDLTRDGVIEARQGRGYFVGDRRQVYSRAERTRRLEQALDTFLSEALVLNFARDEICAALDKRLARFEPGGRLKGGQADE
jgi:GntR family transcriptional regulator